MQEVIIYRNPAEAAFWNAVMNAEFFPAIVGIIVFLIVFVVTNGIATRKWGSWGKAARTRTNICLALGTVASVATIWKMWL